MMRITTKRDCNNTRQFRFGSVLVLFHLDENQSSALSGHSTNTYSFVHWLIRILMRPNNAKVVHAIYIKYKQEFIAISFNMILIWLFVVVTLLQFLFFVCVVFLFSRMGERERWSAHAPNSHTMLTLETQRLYTCLFVWPI